MTRNASGGQSWAFQSYESYVGHASRAPGVSCGFHASFFCLPPGPPRPRSVNTVNTAKFIRANELPPYGSNTTTDNEDPIDVSIDLSLEAILGRWQPQPSDDIPPLRVRVPGGGPAYNEDPIDVSEAILGPWLPQPSDDIPSLRKRATGCFIWGKGL